MEEKVNKSADDVESEDPENIIINEVDGLPNLHPNFEQLELNCTKSQSLEEDPSSRTLEDLIHDEDLPMSVIVTNVDPRVFKSDELKVILRFNYQRYIFEDFTYLFNYYNIIFQLHYYYHLQADIERLFKQFGEDATFHYFRSFRRMRVNYSSPSAAAQARIQLHQAHFGDTDINCYFAQPVTPIGQLWIPILKNFQSKIFN